MSFQSCINENYSATFNNLTVNGQLALSSGSISDLTVSNELTCPLINSTSSNLSIVPNTIVSGTLQVNSATNLTNTNISGILNVGNTLTSTNINNSTNLTTSTLNCSQMFNSLNSPVFPVYAYASNYNNVNLEVNCSVNFIANSTSSSYTVSCSGCVGILVANSSAYTCSVGLESISGSTYTWIINCSGGGSSPNAQNAYISLMII
jgi:hypothetical protein